MKLSRLVAIAAMFPIAVGAAFAAQLSNQDQEYLRDRARTLMADVQAGELASQKATTDEVRAFAYRLVADHKHALENVRKLAAERKVELPAAPDEGDMESITKLKGLSGVKFDEQYMKRAIHQHKLNTKSDRKRRYGTKDPEMRALASATHDVEDQHLALANRALASIVIK